MCIASNGPGVANALPGVAVENGEGNRVLLITSWRRSPIVHPDRGGTYQYFDQVAVTRPMTKWSGAAMDFDRLAEMLRRALRVSWQGRPGVVHVCVPEDVINGEFDAPRRGPIRLRRATGGRRRSPPTTSVVRHAADLLDDRRAPDDPRRQWRAPRRRRPPSSASSRSCCARPSPRAGARAT